MCIRDRGLSDGAGADGAVGAGALAGVSLEEMAMTDWNPAAVSYTHLRAHETVLELVCRLLLETKNKPHT